MTSPESENPRRRPQSRRNTGSQTSTADQQATQETQALTNEEPATPQQEGNGQSTGVKGDTMTTAGTLTIEDAVVGKVASSAAEQVEGVHTIGAPSLTRTVAEALGAAGGGRRGVNVQVGQSEASFDITIVVDEGHRIPDVARRVKERVAQQVSETCGLAVKRVNILVADKEVTCELN